MRFVSLKSARSPIRVILIGLALTLPLCGCASTLSEVIVSAPNRFHPFKSWPMYSSPERRLLGIDKQFRVDVGPPEATLGVFVVEPEEVAKPRGTVLVLHGIRERNLSMLGTAHMLAEAGYRAVLVDLRGHGASTGKWLTYGPQESQDLSQVIDELEKRNLIASRLGVYGISYGATTSIHLAGRDPRVAAVVAVAPFSKMRDEVPDYSHTLLPGVGNLIEDDFFQEAVDEAGEMGDFDPDESDALAAIARTQAPVLLMHGKLDWLVPPYHSVRLQEAGNPQTRLELMPGLGHVTIWFDPQGAVAEKTRVWFDQHLCGLDPQSMNP